MSLYAISRTVRFDNETFALYAAEAAEEQLRIGAIASRCLTLLLQANGEVVSKRELMSGAWGSFGLEVTENSLAQVVRQLRVALDKLQPGNELILTVPRIGYRIGERARLLDVTQPSEAADEPAIAPASEALPPPAPSTQAHGRWLYGLPLAAAALACWGLLFKLPGLLFPVQLPEQPFMEAQALQIDGLVLHREALPEAALRPDDKQLAARAQKLGQALAFDNLHLYRFAGQERSIDLLCNGELRPGASHCVGLQIDE